MFFFCSHTDVREQLIDRGKLRRTQIGSSNLGLLNTIYCCLVTIQDTAMGYQK